MVSVLNWLGPCVRHAREVVFVHVGVHTVLQKPTVHRTRLCCSSDVCRQPFLKLDNLAVWQVREPAARASAGGVVVSAAAVAAVIKLPAIARCARLRKVTSATGAAAAAARAAAVAAGELALVFDEARVRHGAPLPPAVREPVHGVLLQCPCQCGSACCHGQLFAAQV